MTTHFTADLHFGHQNIIRYCDRPFPNAAVMDEALIDNWNDVVADGDTVWVLGDFALGRIADTLPLAARLRGHKILVAGNHDRCWAGHGPRADAWVDRYLDAGFDEIIQGSTSVDLDGTDVLVSHFPYVGDSHDHDRFVEHRPTDTGSWLLHGHVHERWAQCGHMINVGVDVNGYRPIDAATLLDRIRSAG
jgi:calcineurin-like phosphoesterase family protein